MHSSKQLLGQVRRALALAALLAACSGILVLAVPLVVLHTLATATASLAVAWPSQLWILAAPATLAYLALACLRQIVLTRAGVWLQHTMTRWLIETAAMRGATGRHLLDEIEAAATLSNAVAQGMMWPLPAFAWALTVCAMAFLVEPMAGVCGGILVLLLAALAWAGPPLLARTGKAAHDQRRSVRWLEAIARPRTIGPAVIDAGSAAREWARHDGPSVSHSYARRNRQLLVRTAAGSLVVVGLVGLIAVKGSSTAAAPEALVACVVMMGLTIAPLLRFAGEPTQRAEARHAWRLLAAATDKAKGPRRMASPARDAGIVLQDASWTYRGARTPAVAAISLSIAPGEAIGLIGPAGAGKSALAALIASAGAIEGRVGYLTDEPVILDGSVRDNIAGFAPAHAPLVERAVVHAGAYDCLAALPHGLDSQAGENGCNLPLRAKRAIALARALCGAPPLVVLDSPELGLDQAGLDRLAVTLQHVRAAGATLVIATSTPMLLESTDRVVVLEQGRITRILSSYQVLSATDSGNVGTPPAAPRRAA